MSTPGVLKIIIPLPFATEHANLLIENIDAAFSSL